MYRNTRTGEVRTREGWRHWAIGYYTAFYSDDLGRDPSAVMHLDVLLPEDWFARVSKMLALERVIVEV